MENAQQWLAAALRDAGCDAASTAQLCRLYERGELDVLRQKLRRHRSALMDAVHASQNRVDCLDCLLHDLQSPTAQKGR